MGQWGPRVGLYLKPSAEYVASTWGTWIARGIAVPLCISHTQSELQYVINDSTMSLVQSFFCLLLVDPIAFKILTDDASKRNLPSMADVHVETISEIRRGEAFLDSVTLPHEEGGALILYTSGTTGKPKGALHTHRSLNAQMESLSKAWGWSERDVLLHALPLHHIHGIVNALYTAHYKGACVHLMPKFSTAQIWTAFRVRSCSRDSTMSFVGRWNFVVYGRSGNVFTFAVLLGESSTRGSNSASKSCSITTSVCEQFCSLPCFCHEEMERCLRALVA